MCEREFDVLYKDGMVYSRITKPDGTVTEGFADPFESAVPLSDIIVLDADESETVRRTGIYMYPSGFMKIGDGVEIRRMKVSIGMSYENI